MKINLPDQLTAPPPTRDYLMDFQVRALEDNQATTP